jgi:chromosome segregation ATPase
MGRASAREWNTFVLESILYFVLGFSSAALIALMISPAIWNRAVVLTRKRVESSVPLTLNEIQADKDQLRAEFAMSTRRLEMSVEELRDKASRQVIDISRKRDELARLSEDSRDRIKMIEELEIRGSELREMLKDREEKLALTNQHITDANAKLETAAHELEGLRFQMSDLQAEADSSRIELVVKQTEMENLNDKVSDASYREQELKAEIAALKKAVADNEISARKSAEMERKYENLEKRLSDSQQMIEQREIELSRLREIIAAEEQIKSDLSNQLTQEKSVNVNLEAKLAQSTLKMEALLYDASNDNVEKAMASLGEDKERLESQLSAIREERDRLKRQLSNHERKDIEEWEIERRENAILRERINDLAAQVTAMTAALEGGNSAIDDLLALTPKPIHVAGKTYALGTQDEDILAANNHKTLADRIRALQESARQNKIG